MPVTRHPRIDPYVRHSRIRLLPRMRSSTGHAGKRMQDVRSARRPQACGWIRPDVREKHHTHKGEDDASTRTHDPLKRGGQPVQPRVSRPNSPPSRPAGMPRATPSLRGARTPRLRWPEPKRRSPWRRSRTASSSRDKRRICASDCSWNPNRLPNKKASSIITPEPFPVLSQVLPLPLHISHRPYGCIRRGQPIVSKWASSLGGSS
jgi:hypothetical protein